MPLELDGCRRSWIRHRERAPEGEDEGDEEVAWWNLAELGSGCDASATVNRFSGWSGFEGL